MLDKYKDVFTEARWNECCDLVATKGMHISNNDFTTSEIEVIINETALTDSEKEAARLRYIKHVRLKDIAARFNYSESDIKYRRRKVSKALRTTCLRIFK